MDFLEWQKRLSILLSVGGLILLSFTGRLYQKTVIEHGQTVEEAESQYAYRKEVEGQRGEIVVAQDDKSYFPLATNERRYQVLVVPKNIKDRKQTAEKLASLIGMTEQEVYDKINNDKLYIPPLKKRLTREVADRIAQLRLRGVVLLPELVRVYPEQTLAAQVLGFVNGEGKGNYGIEGALDLTLRGASGYQTGEKDSHGRLINVGDEVKAQDGSTVVLSIDREIQHYAEQALADAIKEYQADSGSVVIMNPKTGGIVALANAPTYNPNEFNKVASDQSAVYQNPSLSSVWEPGSIMKPIVMALAVDKGLVEPETQETFAASVKVLNHTIWTAEKKAFGLETMTQVLENSDNVGMVWIANKLGNNGEYDGLKQFGIGTAPDMNLSNVVGGFMPGLKNWNDLTRATISFGQGVSTTPLQMAIAYSALANKGVMMQPYLVEKVIDEKGVLTETQPKELGRVVSETTSEKLGRMLEAVVVNGHGKHAAVPGYRVGGKTGTAQVVKPEGGYYDDRHIGSFAGYFPLTDPQFVMVVKIDNPKATKFAESSAAPTFGRIANWILSYKQILPDKPMQ
ncbi:MAG TPA: penicillin-binding protein 2 [Patescibacteria group bacterium]